MSAHGGNKPKTDVKKKRILIVAAVLVCAIPVMYLLTLIFDRDWNEILHSASVEEVKSTRPIKFAEADYEEDIFEDEAYLDKNRYIQYTEGAVSQLITEDHARYGIGPEFFARYFSAVISGDNEALNTMYTEEWFGENEPHDIFTMQKVYNITVEKLSETVFEDGKYKGVKQYTYRVAYMIKDNNGTFRDDMGSDAAVPQIFELLDYGDGVKINSITKYTHIR